MLNLAGPYTPKAQNLIAACIDAGASYVDLSGEIPLLRRVIDRFDEPARLAGGQVVQMAGWEAMPADLTTLIACRRAAGPESSPDGPGAAGPIVQVTVTINFKRQPEGGVPFKQGVSAGTLASIVAMLDDPEAGLVGQPGALLPKRAAEASGQHPGALRLGASDAGGRVLGPVVPVAFLNPPIIHRTAALLAAERSAAYQPALYVEGVDSGSASGLAGLGRKWRAKAKAASQRLASKVTRLPLPVRRMLAGLLRTILPKSGTGPSGCYLSDWEWTVTAHATSRGGAAGTATLEGTGHPGYTATAAFIVETALSMADYDRQARRCGCVTPALVIGAAVEQPSVRSLRLR